MTGAARLVLRRWGTSGVDFIQGPAGSNGRHWGFQGKDTLLNLFDEAAFVDGGVSTESVGAIRPDVALEGVTAFPLTASPGIDLTSLTDLQADHRRPRETQNDVTVQPHQRGQRPAGGHDGSHPRGSGGRTRPGNDLSLSLDSQTGPQGGVAHVHRVYRPTPLPG